MRRVGAGGLVAAWDFAWDFGRRGRGATRVRRDREAREQVGGQLVGREADRVDVPAVGGQPAWLARQDERAEVSVLAEAFVPTRCAPNAMLWIGAAPDEISLVGVTDQRITDRCIHSGNEYPSTTRFGSELAEGSRRLAVAMQREGFVGYAGFDFIEATAEHAGGAGLHFVEINPRVNAALIPLQVTRLVNQRQVARGNPPVGSFLQRYRKVAPGRFSLYRDRLSGLAFREGRGAGVIHHPPASLDAGALSYVVLGRSREEVDGIEQELAVALGQ